MGIIPHEGYTHTRTHEKTIVQLTCTMMPQLRHWGVLPPPQALYYAAEVYEISRVHGFVLAVFPLKYGFIIVQRYCIF